MSEFEAKYQMDIDDFIECTAELISYDAREQFDWDRDRDFFGYWALELLCCSHRVTENLERMDSTWIQVVNLLLHVMFEFDRNVVWLKNWDGPRLEWLFDLIDDSGKEPGFTLRFKDVSDIDPETLKEYGFDAEGIRRPRTVEATHP